MSKPALYTVVADYGATGEGSTISVLYTRAYGAQSREQNALDAFKRQFGDWLAQGATVHEGAYFGYYEADFLVSPQLRQKLTEWADSDNQLRPGGLEVALSCHMNFS